MPTVWLIGSLAAEMAFHPARRHAVASSARPRSEQSLQFRRCHTDIRQNAAKCSFRDVATWVNGNGGAASIGMAHHVMAPCDPRDLEPGPL